jgi:molybdate/tungstate transport system substrate-binding protein
LKSLTDKRRFLLKATLSRATLSILIIAILVAALSCSGQTQTLSVFHAGSLAVPLTSLKTEFEAQHSNVDVVLTSGGSATIISDAIAQEDAGESPPDIIASADYSLIPSKMYAGNYSDWYIAFARNAMVLCYRDNAPGSADIVSGNRTWYDIIRNDPVSYGHADPDQDPCGYRTLMVVQLAQEYYCDNATSFNLTPDSNACGLYDALIPGGPDDRGRIGGTNTTARPGGSAEVVAAKSVDLINALQTGDLDYAFEYRSVAVQHDLNYVDLADHINLSKIDAELPGVEEFYTTASVETLKDPGPPPTYSTQYGAAIVYGVTIPAHAENTELAAEFISLLLSATGKEIMETENGQPMLNPPICDHPENLPASLQNLFD